MSINDIRENKILTKNFPIYSSVLNESEMLT